MKLKNASKKVDIFHQQHLSKLRQRVKKKFWYMYQSRFIRDFIIFFYSCFWFFFICGIKKMENQQPKN